MTSDNSYIMTLTDAVAAPEKVFASLIRQLSIATQVTIYNCRDSARKAAQAFACWAVSPAGGRQQQWLRGRPGPSVSTLSTGVHR